MYIIFFTLCQKLHLILLIKIRYDKLGVILVGYTLAMESYTV